MVRFLYRRGCGRHCCGRHGFGRYNPPCGRHGLILGPLSFVAVIAVAVIVCGRHSRSPRNRRHKLAPFFWRRFFVPCASGMKISDAENKLAENIR